MSEQGQSNITKWVLIVVVCLVLYNLVTGHIIREISLPGFGIKFDPRHEPSPSPTVQPTRELPTPTPTVAPTIDLSKIIGKDNQSLPPFNKEEYLSPPAPRMNYACAPVPGIFYLQYPQTWYGPFGQGFAIGWSQGGGFGVWNPYTYQYMNYPDPYNTIQRNTWLRLPNTPFNICIDTYGYVYGQYIGQ